MPSATSPSVATGGTPRPGHSLQGHQPVVGQQSLGQEGGPVLFDGVVLEAVETGVEPVWVLPQQGQGLCRAAGQCPPALGFAWPCLRLEKGVWPPNIPDQEPPSLFFLPWNSTLGVPMPRKDLKLDLNPSPETLKAGQSHLSVPGLPQCLLCASCTQDSDPGCAQGVSWPLELGNPTGTEEGWKGGLPWGSAPGDATEVGTYFKESRTWFFFRASPRALAPVGPMQLLLRLEWDRRKAKVSKAGLAQAQFKSDASTWHC